MFTAEGDGRVRKPFSDEANKVGNRRPLVRKHHGDSDETGILREWHGQYPRDAFQPGSLVISGTNLGSGTDGVDHNNLISGILMAAEIYAKPKGIVIDVVAKRKDLTAGGRTRQTLDLSIPSTLGISDA